MRSIRQRIVGRLLRPYGWTCSQIRRLHIKPNTINYPIDFVVTWVDGSDSDWLDSQIPYKDEKHQNMGGDAACRYRDWGLMKYWFRAVEQYAPWVRKVFFVTCGQRPEWLNYQCNKLEIITHDQFIPKKYLPTFNSPTIELNLWRISDLSEHFVYFNDDMFINRTIYPKDFFYCNVPKICAIGVPFRLYRPRRYQFWTHTLINDIAVINNSFDIKRVIQTYPYKFYSYVYGRQTSYNERIYRDGYLTGMHHTHSVQTYKKSIFVDMWKREYDILDYSCNFKFRSEEQVTPFLPTLWHIFSGEYEPVPINYFGEYFDITKKALPDIEKAMKGESKIICINDGEQMDGKNDEILYIKQELLEMFQKKFPTPSQYEN